MDPEIAGDAPSTHPIRALKAGADAQRTGMERLADGVSALFSSNGFLFANIVWFIIWGVWNAGVIPGLPVFDPFPFGLLTMIVSLEAILLSIFVLIAQRRTEQIDDIRNEVDLHVNLIAEDELTKLLELVSQLAAKAGIDVAGDAKLQAMLAPTNVEKIQGVIERQIKPPAHGARTQR